MKPTTERLFGSIYPRQAVDRCCFNQILTARCKHTAAAVINKLTVLLRAMNHLCPAFNKTGLELATNLDFPQEWGLGSSSTLINNLGQWLQINPYELLEKSFGGSGYDIAAAQSRSPLFYTRNVYSPTVETSTFVPLVHCFLFI